VTLVLLALFASACADLSADERALLDRADAERSAEFDAANRDDADLASFNSAANAQDLSDLA